MGRYFPSAAYLGVYKRGAAGAFPLTSASGQRWTILGSNKSPNPPPNSTIAKTPSQSGPSNTAAIVRFALPLEQNSRKHDSRELCYSFVLKPYLQASHHPWKRLSSLLVPASFTSPCDLQPATSALSAIFLVTTQDTRRGF